MCEACVKNQDYRVQYDIKKAKKLFYNEKEFLELLLSEWGTATDKGLKKGLAGFSAVRGKLDNQDIDRITRLMADTINATMLKNTINKVPILMTDSYRTAKKSIVDQIGVFLKWEYVDELAVEWLASNHMYWIGTYYDKYVSQALSDVAKEGIEKGLGRKAVGQEMKKFFSIYDGVKVKPDTYWTGLAGNGMNRARTFGLVQGYVDTGVKYTQILAVLDERTSEICERLDGKRFPVWSAAAQMDLLMSSQSPEDVKLIAPWPSVDDLKKNKSVSDLIGIGVVMPPFHFNCRTTIIEVF